MAWFKIDDNLYDHPKFLALSDKALAVWVRAGSYCAKHLTDGAIPPAMVPRVGGTKAVVRELVDAGLWEEDGDGYRFHDWLVYQPSREKVMAERKAAADRMRRRRARQRGDDDGGSDDGADDGSGEHPDETFAATSPSPTRPDPTRELKPPKPPAGGTARQRRERKAREVFERAERFRVARLLRGRGGRKASDQAVRRLLALVKHVQSSRGVDEPGAWSVVEAYAEGAIREAEKAVERGDDFGPKLVRWRGDGNEWRPSRFDTWAAKNEALIADIASPPPPEPSADPPPLGDPPASDGALALLDAARDRAMAGRTVA